MDSHRIHEQAAESHLALLQDMGSFVPRLESIQDQANVFLVGLGLDRVWTEHLGVRFRRLSERRT